jgi:ABC-2 type transport system ATP-binding protein
MRDRAAVGVRGVGDVPSSQRQSAAVSGSSTGRDTRPDVDPVVDARNVVRRFGSVVALDEVSLSVPAGEIHALLGPNGAGKTTMMRIITGLVDADAGAVRVAGVDPSRSTRTLRSRVGLVPSGDRSLYLRLSGFENLLFFARLHGLRRRAARARALEALELVDLVDAAHVRVGVYSHGMQKRLSVARALLTKPAVLLVDEATHDLDPVAAENVRALVSGLADDGAAIVWATQRVDEVRSFADSVTLLARGRVRFAGTVAELMAHASARRYLVHLENGKADDSRGGLALQDALGELGSIVEAVDGDRGHYLLSLGEDALLGDALAAIHNAGFQLLGCREERSEIEGAFLTLTREDEA